MDGLLTTGLHLPMGKVYSTKTGFGQRNKGSGFSMEYLISALSN
jgi:hypothetical protein